MTRIIFFFPFHDILLIWCVKREILKWEFYDIIEKSEEDTG